MIVHGKCKVVRIVQRYLCALVDGGAPINGKFTIVTSSRIQFVPRFNFAITHRVNVKQVVPKGLSKLHPNCR